MTHVLLSSTVFCGEAKTDINSVEIRRVRSYFFSLAYNTSAQFCKGKQQQPIQAQDELLRNKISGY